MQKHYVRIFIFLVFLTVFGCNKAGDPVSSGVRVGAICNDGTTSTATGSGACSHHGGVKEWIYR
jgi:hypothetical protein